MNLNTEDLNYLMRDTIEEYHLSIPKTVTNIVNFSMSDGNGQGYTENVKSITFPNKLKYINDKCFSNLRYLEVVDLSKCSSLESLSDDCFNSSSSIKNVLLPDTLKSIGKYCFAYCSGLESMDISNCSSLETIGDYCFYQCSEIKNIDLSQCNNLIYIGESAFDFCTSLEELYIPSSTETIGENCFSGCKSLEKIYIDRLTDSIAGAPWGAKSSTKIIWKDSNVNATINITPISDTTMTINSYNDDELVETEIVEMLANIPSSVTTSVKQNKMYIANVVEKDEKEVEVVNKDNVLYYAWEGYDEEDEKYEIFYTTENISTPGNDLDIDVYDKKFDNVTKRMAIVCVGEDHHGLYLWDDAGMFTSVDCYRNPEKDIYETTTTTQIVETQIYSESGLTDSDIVMNVEQPMPSTVKFTLIPPANADYMSITVNGETEDVELLEYAGYGYDDFCLATKKEYEVDKGTEITYTFRLFDDIFRYGDDEGYINPTETIVVNEDTIKDFWKDRIKVTVNYTIPIISSSNTSPNPWFGFYTNGGDGSFNLEIDLREPSPSEVIKYSETYDVAPYSGVVVTASHNKYYPTIYITNSKLYPSDNYQDTGDMSGFGMYVCDGDIIEFTTE